MLKIQILKKNKQWYFRIVARNGRILCHSETYSTKAKAIKSATMLYHGDFSGIFVQETKKEK